MTIVDEVAFQRVDTRIARLLLNRSQIQNPIYITHQGIAAELGSSREVVSRILEGFAREELILTARGTIKVLDFESLQTRSAV